MSIAMNEETKEGLQKILGDLPSPVKLIFFTQKDACPTCAQQQELLQQLASLSNRLELKIYDFVLHGEEVAGYRIERIPATVVAGEKDYGIRFYGLTIGYEFASLLEAIMMVSTGQSGLDPDLETLVREIKEKVRMQVFVTLTCPYCPKIVHIADQFAFVNDNIQADMVESAEFPRLALKYNVTGVPKTIINEAYSFEGALPETAVYMEILKAVNPEKYRQLEEEIRKIQGAPKAKMAEEKHEYEVIIVGGGPAAMSAAIYALRKGLDVAMIAKKLGGQITYTASVENYLGLPPISGADMAEKFRNHLESYPIAEALGANVSQVKREDNSFVVVTDDNRQFKALSVIYCAGKEYSRLGVPGEELFVGKGIGFCATCDAPLYRDKRVAVVGGGNSAFTAARDLLNFASEVHLIHRQNEFRADEALVQEVTRAKNIILHTPMIVSSFLGTDKLTGVQLESVDGKDRLDLNVDGVFLEIGLTPNSSPLNGLIKLNEWGEVPVNRDQSTTMNGLFAAGDVTDVREKQISIAVGQGALAALTAHRYLVENKLTKSKIELKETWQ
ncbi:MAG: FAD-dependent oxidoreductase [Candidatus Methanomethylicaceae archaeon]